MMSLKKRIAIELRKEEVDVREAWNHLPTYRNGILEGIRLAELIVRQEIIREK